MKKIIFAISIFVMLCACDGDTTKESAARDAYVPSGITPTKMVFPGGSSTTYKSFRDFKKDVKPTSYSHPNKWVIYIAATGWTNGGLAITTRTANDAGHMAVIKNFLDQNNLSNKVHTAWIQYDKNPSPQFVESIDLVPSNYIPFFLKEQGPDVNYYIHSFTSRYNKGGDILRYDEWLKPFMKHSNYVNGKWETTSPFQMDAGYYDYKSPYWDQWARHFFIVNPDGIVVDAYLSNMGHSKSYSSKSAIKSIIYHLGLNENDMVVPKLFETSYTSTYTAPYWDEINNAAINAFGLK